MIDMRERLGLGRREADEKPMGVTVEQGPELYTLLVDKVGDVVSLSTEFYEDNPSTLDTPWREFALGVYRFDGPLMVVLDVDHILDISYSS